MAQTKIVGVNPWTWLSKVGNSYGCISSDLLGKWKGISNTFGFHSYFSLYSRSAGAFDVKSKMLFLILIVSPLLTLIQAKINPGAPVWLLCASYVSSVFGWLVFDCYRYYEGTAQFYASEDYKVILKLERQCAELEKRYAELSPGSSSYYGNRFRG